MSQSTPSINLKRPSVPADWDAFRAVKRDGNKNSGTVLASPAGICLKVKREENILIRPRDMQHNLLLIHNIGWNREEGGVGWDGGALVSPAMNAARN